MSFNEFVEIGNQSDALGRTHNSVKLLVNIENMSVLSQDIQKWLQDVWFSKVVEMGLKYTAYVVPKNDLGNMSMKNANKKADKESLIESQYFDNEQDAKKWLMSKN